MPKNKRKYKGERHVRLAHYLLSHPSWVQLSPKAQLIFIEIKRRFNGFNNGEIALSCRDAAQIAKCSRDTALRALIELEYYGHIILCKMGTFGNRHASEFILTHEGYNNRPATNDWKASRPDFKTYARTSNTDLKSLLKHRKANIEAQIVSQERL